MKIIKVKTRGIVTTDSNKDKETTYHMELNDGGMFQAWYKDGDKDAMELLQRRLKFTRSQALKALADSKKKPTEIQLHQGFLTIKTFKKGK